MMHRLAHPGAYLLAVTVALGISALVGCSHQDAPPPPANPGPAVDHMSAAGGGSGSGEALFSARCAGCHTINGAGGQRGPDLSHAGSDPKHTPEWLAAFIKDPSSQKPGSRMPAFGGKIPDSDIQAISNYLSSLK